MNYDAEYWRVHAIAAQADAERCSRCAIDYLTNEGGQRNRILARVWQGMASNAYDRARGCMELAEGL